MMVMMMMVVVGFGPVQRKSRIFEIMIKRFGDFRCQSRNFESGIKEIKISNLA